MWTSKIVQEHWTYLYGKATLWYCAHWNKINKRNVILFFNEVVKHNLCLCGRLSLVFSLQHMLSSMSFLIILSGEAEFIVDLLYYL